MFAIIYAAITRDEQKNIKDLELLKKLLKFENIFFNKIIEVLLAFKQRNHAIEIEKDKELLYKSLYNLF